MSLQKGDTGKEVRQLQTLLVKLGYLPKNGVDVDYGNQTMNAVRTFQARNMDQHGQPLVVDGKVGPLTWWSLTHPKPNIETVSAVDFTKLPATALGGSAYGRAALKNAIAELKAGARELGGNNKGPFVKKYLAGAGLPEGNAWCASFVSWCMLQAVNGDKTKMPVKYNALARGLLNQFRVKGFTSAPTDGYVPVPGDLVFWWREALKSPLGHVGFVHSVKDGMLYTIEGNKSSRVQGFSYVLSRMDRLLGFGRMPEIK